MLSPVIKLKFDKKFSQKIQGHLSRTLSRFFKIVRANLFFYFSILDLKKLRSNIKREEL